MTANQEEERTAAAPLLKLLSVLPEKITSKRGGGSLPWPFLINTNLNGHPSLLVREQKH